MPCADATVVATAAATRASAAGDKHSEQCADDREPHLHSLTSPARLCYSAPGQHQPGQRQSEVMPQQVRASAQLRTRTRRRGHDFQEHIGVSLSGGHLAGSEGAGGQRGHSETGA